MSAELGAVNISVVIPVRNGADTIAAQLEALASQRCDEPWELVVADNGSTDDTTTIAQSYSTRFRQLRIVHEDRAPGINIARNAGVRAARGSLVLICDADDEVHPGWLEAHLAGLEKYDITGGPLDQVSLNTVVVATFNERRQDGCPISGRFLPYATGCNFAFRREVWEAIGGFDDRWVRGATEIEFCWRAQLAGFTIGWVPDAVVAYRQQPTLRMEVRRRFRSARANPRLFARFRKNGMPRSGTWSALRAWAWLLYRWPWAILDRGWRLKWLQVAAWRVGLLAGSLRHRVLYL